MDITMPQLGETVTEGTITRWIKQVGDAVTADEPLFEVSTDKVDSEVPAPASGTLTEILIPAGETAAVGAKLAVLGETGAAPAPPAPVWVRMVAATVVGLWITLLESTVAPVTMSYLTVAASPSIAVVNAGAVTSSS